MSGGAARGRRSNKYSARRCECSQSGVAHWHDSLKERARCFVLHQRQAAGEITDLSLHPRFPLMVQGKLICHYTADFLYYEQGAVIVEDVKSQPTRTRDYLLRKKLMRAVHGVAIRET